MSDNYDVVVIGAGAGGLFTTARMAHRGYRTLVVERLDVVGGRASTVDIDGFKVNKGAIVIEVGGITEQTCRDVGADFDIREPSPPILYRIGKKDIDVTGGGWGLLLGKLTHQGAKLVSSLGAARNGSGLPEDEISTADWVRKYTKNEGVHGIFRNMCASVFAVGSEDLPTRVFLTYFTRKSAFKRFGFHPEGTLGLWQSLARAIERDGGEILLDAQVESITVAGDTASHIVISHAGQTREVHARVVVSDIGPAATVALIGYDSFPSGYLDDVKRADRPTSMITVNFASQERLIEAPGMLSFRQDAAAGLHGQLHRHLPRDGTGWVESLRRHVGARQPGIARPSPLGMLRAVAAGSVPVVGQVRLVSRSEVRSVMSRPYSAATRLSGPVAGRTSWRHPRACSPGYGGRGSRRRGRTASAAARHW